MRPTARTLLSTAGAIALVVGNFCLLPQIANAEEKSMVEKGKEVAVDRKKGNCLACHKMADEPLPGNIGPELVNMKARYPDKAKLRAQIWDATANNPNTSMPPYGKHKIVTEEELDAIVEFVYTL